LGLDILGGYVKVAPWGQAFCPMAREDRTDSIMGIMFWMFAAVITVGVVVVLLRPLLAPTDPGQRARAGAVPEDGAAGEGATLDADAERALAVYRDQLAEVERDCARGVLAPAEADAARTEVSRRLLAAGRRLRRAGDIAGSGAEGGGDSGADGGAGAAAAGSGTASPSTAGAPAAARPDRRSLRLAVVLAVAIPVAALGLYVAVGSPDLADRPLAARQAEAQSAGGPDEGGTMPPEIQAAISRLEQRLAESPADPDGWRLLALSYRRLGRLDDSVAAWRRVLAQSAPDPDLTAAFAEAVVAANRGLVTDEAIAAFKSALAGAPDHPLARFFLALSRAQAGDLEGALAGWQALAADTPEDAPWLEPVRQQIMATARRLGRDPVQAVPAR